MASSSAVSSPPASPSSPAAVPDNDVMFIPIDLESSFGRLKRPHSMLSSSSELSSSAATAASHSKASSRNSLTRTSLKTPFVDAAAPTATPAAAVDATTATPAALLVSNHNDEQSNSSSTTNESTTTKTTTNNSATTSSQHQQQQSLFKPYPISETTDEIVERRRLSESASVIMGFVSSASTSPSFDRSECDQHSMMEVTVDGLSSSQHHNTTPPATEEFDFVLSAEEEGSLVNEVESVYNTTTQSRGGFCWDTPITIVDSGRTTLLQQHQQDELMSSSLDVPFSVSYSKSMTQHQEEEEHPDETFPIRSTDMDW